jgi:hypothetical protein
LIVLTGHAGAKQLEFEPVARNPRGSQNSSLSYSGKDGTGDPKGVALRRDARDKTRAAAPLRAAKDAIIRPR